MPSPSIIKSKEGLSTLFQEARELSWQRWGRKITFYLPGMIRYGNEWGKYPALSITGNSCELRCDHCNSKILESMLSVSTPEELVEKCFRLVERGNIGCLISGGSFKDGTLPWGRFIKAIAKIKRETNLKISIHTGLIDYVLAKQFKDAGVDQALIDVIGDEETLKKVYHLDLPLSAIEDSLGSLARAEIPIVPHIVVGLHYGQIRGEWAALDLISRYNPSILVIVILMPLTGTPMEEVIPPPPLEVAKIVARARLKMPNTTISLGCARPRGKYSLLIELLAIEAGVNRIAIQSDAAIEKAREYGLEVNFQKTCCSLDLLPTSSL